MNNEQRSVSDRQALQNFVLDIQCLDELYEWSKSGNIFDILNISKFEIRHSSVLRWLLDPNENHALGDRVLRGVIQKLASGAKGDPLEHTLHFVDLNNVQVLREWRHIDLLVISHEEKFLIAIENKIRARERKNQLSDYRKTLEKEYPGYYKLFSLLTPAGRSSEESEEQEVWRELSYSDVIEIIESATSGNYYFHIPVDSGTIISQYIDTVRRHIMGDPRLEEACRKIYAKHRRALDLIYENRYDQAARVAEIVKVWCQEKAACQELVFDPDGAENSSKTYIRFTTPRMSELLPALEEPTGEWKTQSIYYYEVVNRGEYIKVVLTVASKDLSEGQRSAVNTLSDRLDRKDKKPDWRWKRLNNWDRHSIQSDPMSEELENEVKTAMDDYWQRIVQFEETL